MGDVEFCLEVYLLCRYSVQRGVMGGKEARREGGGGTVRCEEEKKSKGLIFGIVTTSSDRSHAYFIRTSTYVVRNSIVQMSLVSSAR